MTAHPTRTLEVRQDRRLIRPGSHSTRYVVATVTAPRARGARRRPPVNLAIVLDRSGSMSGPKLATAKLAIEEAVGRLEAEDRFSLVVYDDIVDVIFESTPATPGARRAAIERLGEIGARGSTNLAEGWLRGCEQVAAHLGPDGVDRCLLLTDGLANVGITDPDTLTGHAAALRARGVSTTTFGVGQDFDEGLLQAIADAGGGHFYYIADAPQIRDAITSEVGEALEVTARGVMLEVTARDDLRVEAVTPHALSGGGGRTWAALGDLVSGGTVEVVLRLSFPYGELGRDAGVIVGLTDRDGLFAGSGPAATEPARLSWSYADDHANDAQPRDPRVDRVVARVFAARARQEAVARNRGGDFQQAGRIMAATARRIRAYAGKDAEMREIARVLEADQEVYAAPMAESLRKQAHYSSSNVLRSRNAMGHSRRDA